MIKSKLGHVEIKGSLPEILQDTIHILNGVYKSIIEKHGVEIANEHIMRIGKIATITDEEEMDELIEEYIIGEQEKILAELPEEKREIGGLLFDLLTSITREEGDK